LNTDYLKDWSVPAETRKADFMQFLYERSGRTCGTYTGLWLKWMEENEGFGEEARDEHYCHVFLDE